MSTIAETIPYERQSDVQSNRLCGAASLAMVYRSFNKTVAQAEIWPKISRRNNLGSLSSATYLMCQDAVSRGFASLAIQVKHPLQTLRLCRERGIRAILSHRLRDDLPTGHYTVFADLDTESVVLHDPYYGPSRRLSHQKLLELWSPGYPDSEITGNVLIGVAARPAGQPAASRLCPECGTEMPASVNCAACDRPIALEPAALLGCVRPSCSARMWNYLCCPSCDYVWSFQPGSSPSQGPGQARADSEQDPWHLDRLFGELDTFCARLRSLPSTAANPEILPYLDFIQGSKEKLRLAQTEELVRRKEQQARLSQMRQHYGRKEAEILKKREDVGKPGAAPDGNALVQALLKSLGLSR